MRIHFIAKDLVIRFGRRTLFKDLSFEACEGELIAITGANGSGKSSLVKLLAGVSGLQKGSVQLRIGGNEIAAEERPLQVGLVAPYLNLYEHFSLLENLEFILKVRGMTIQQSELAALIETVQLKGSEKLWIHKYSSGMKQRARFAAALLPSPSIFFLDEPTANLDENGKAMVWQIVETLKQQQKLVFIATNEPSEAARADRVIAL